MAHVHLESLVDLRQKDIFSYKHRRTLTLAVVCIGATILGMIFVRGVFHNTALLTIEPPMSTDISLRPDFPVSTYLHPRSFKWFIGVALKTFLYATAFSALGVACVAATAGVVLAGCVLAAVAAAATIVGAIQQHTTDRKLSLAANSMIYMDWVDKSAKRTIDSPTPELDFDRDEFLHSIFGSNYTFAGMITNESEHNRHLWERNRGSDLPVFSFTTREGINLHHVYIHDKEEGTKFHRFGFQSGTSTAAIAPRASSLADTEECFSSGGIDALDCSADDTNELSINDQDQMQKELICALPTFNSSTEFMLQIYDATTMETIAAGRIAPVNANGSSVIRSQSKTSCIPQKDLPLTQGDNCGDQTSAAGDSRR